MKDFYKIIGVDKKATLKDIKKRFREKALLIHPDKSGQNTKDDFIELYEAYEILTDKKKRERYNKIYDWIETPTNEQKDSELTKDLILIHEKALTYADNYNKFDKEVIAHIVLDLFFSTDQLLFASLATITIGLWTIGKGLINLQFDYSFIGLILAMTGVWLAKLKLDRIREKASR
jgi:curved DNA-binding protein CbpA